MRALTLLFFNLLAWPTYAQFLDEGTLIAPVEAGEYFAGGAKDRGHIYILPNELNPEAAKPILAQAASGVYISVGAERGLMGVLQSPNVTHLIQIDLVPEVVLYNQANVILLKIARDLSQFLSLRRGSFEEWKSHASDPQLNENERELLNSAEFNSQYLRLEAGARERLLLPEYFLGSSYLKSADLFSRIQSMAKAGHIQIVQANLTDTGALRAIAQQLQQRQLTISVMDLSNAWEVKYIGENGVNAVIDALKPALTDKSILLATNVARCIQPHFCLWQFRGYSVGALLEVQEKMGPSHRLSYLLSQVRHLPAQRLYNSGDISRLRLLRMSVLHSVSQTAKACARMLLPK